MIESFILLAIVVQYAVCRKIPKYRYISPLICLAACMLILFCAVQLEPWSGDRYIVTAIGDGLESVEVTFDTWQEAARRKMISWRSAASRLTRRHAACG